MSSKAYMFEGCADNLEILQRQYPHMPYWIKMRLVWYAHPGLEPGMKACCDRWFFGPTEEALNMNIKEYIGHNGIIEAYAHKPEEKQNESDTQVSQ